MKSSKFVDRLLSFLIFLSALFLVWAVAGRSFHPPLEKNIYRALGVLGIAIFGYIRTRKGEAKLNLMFSVISLGFAIYAGEIFLFIVDPMPWIAGENFDYGIPKKILETAKKDHVPYDTRSRFAMVRDFREKGTNAYPFVVPINLVNGSSGMKNGFPTPSGKNVLPLAGISNSETVFCNESGVYANYVSDEHGFNNPPGLWKPGAVDLAITGDSFVHGACVPADKTLSAHLTRLSGWKVLNAGAGGSGTLIEFAVLKEYLSVVKPKAVAMFYYEQNDLGRSTDDLQGMITEMESPILMDYLKPNFSQGLLGRQAEIDGIMKSFVDDEYSKHLAVAKQSKLGAITKLAHIRYRLRHLAWDNADLLKSESDLDEGLVSQPDPLFKKLLQESRDLVSSWGGRFYFVYLPSPERYNHRMKGNFYRDEVLAIVKELHLPLIDLHEELFSKMQDPLKFVPFRYYNHYTGDGYEQIAKAVLRRIQEDHVVTGKP